MDQRTGHNQRSSEAQGTMKTEDMARVEERVQETIEGIKSTVDPFSLCPMVPMVAPFAPSVARLGASLHVSFPHLWEEVWILELL